MNYYKIPKDWKESVEEYNKMFYLDSGHKIRYKISSFNSRAEDVAEVDSYTGYKKVNINRRGCFAYRIVWALVHQELAQDTIDHIDGNGMNNDPENLRCVLQEVNNKNQSLKVTNKSGLHGVRWHNQFNKWEVYINIGRKRKHLALTEDFFKACCIRKSAEIGNDYHENHGRTK